MDLETTRRLRWLQQASATEGLVALVPACALRGDVEGKTLRLIELPVGGRRRPASSKGGKKNSPEYLDSQNPNGGAVAGLVLPINHLLTLRFLSQVAVL